MLSFLTSYLLRFRQVSIPAIGNFTIQSIPASVDFGEKLLLPPTAVVKYDEEVVVSKSQLHFLASQLDINEEDVHNQLHAFGNSLRSKLPEGSFRWNGIGDLALAGNKITFQSLLPQLLQPVSAQRVIREDATHIVRQGEDRVKSSFQQASEEVITEKRELEWLAWLLIVLALLFIVFCFYQNGFSIHTTGLKKGATQNLFYQNQ